jgi:hypothetical protein
LLQGAAIGREGELTGLKVDNGLVANGREKLPGASSQRQHQQRQNASQTIGSDSQHKPSASLTRYIMFVCGIVNVIGRQTHTHSSTSPPTMQLPLRFSPYG